MGKFKPHNTIYVDTECTGLRAAHGDRPFAFPLSDEDGNTYYTQWHVDPFSRRVQPVDSDRNFLRRYLTDERYRKVFFNAPFDVHMLESVEIETRGIIEDAGVAARICHTLEPTYKLKPLCFKYGEIPMDDEAALQKRVASCRRRAVKLGWKVHESVAADYWIPFQLDSTYTECEEYALKDVYPRTLFLWMMYESVMKAKGNQDLAEAYRFEMRDYFPVILDIYERGVAVNKKQNEVGLALAQERAQKERDGLQRMLAERGCSWLADGKKPAKSKAKRAAVIPADEFNPGSNPQLSRVLYSPAPVGLGLPVTRYTKNTETRTPSTDWKALRPHLTHPFVQGIARYRSAEKEFGTYRSSYQRSMVPDPDVKNGWMIHVNINQLGANKTSRQSSNDPNFQNVGDANNNPNSPAPIQVRDSFGPRPGFVWLSLDYSGQEIRMFAFIAKIKAMLESLLSGRDVNTDSANRAWGGRNNQHAWQAAAYSLELGALKPSTELVAKAWRELKWSSIKAATYGFNSNEAFEVAERWLRAFKYDIVDAEASLGIKRARTRAKNLTYAKIYGAGKNGVVDMLYCSLNEAGDMLNRFDEIYPGIKEFQYEFASEAKRRGYIHNIFGRRLDIEPQFAYKAVNYIVQGSAADQVKRAEVSCTRFFERAGLRPKVSTPMSRAARVRRTHARVALPVHDEIIFEHRESELKTWHIRGLRNIMEGVTDGIMDLPMPVECHIIRERWDMKEKVEL